MSVCTTSAYKRSTTYVHECTLLFRGRVYEELSAYHGESHRGSDKGRSPCRYLHYFHRTGQSVAQVYRTTNSERKLMNHA